ncbi:helix-turn-helix transcriptional regulator [Rhodococcus sp. NBC_00297]|jgi:predicted DNA-binding transcriptional regulator YafY|uniref:helix-turn-helix transcriptional regulator n=1 Tax=Rhodococcus sp. NBC_00297 TaxID=2976005 RepID=UPI002E2E2AE2|nr:YafY family protein [Rhodococcus sp. NBC_00297]
MPAPSSRMLTLLSLLQHRRDWPGEELARRLEVSPRTVRRDVDRLRELGYAVSSAKGPDGGYRLDAGADLPPLLFDDDQAVALAVALGGATSLGVDVAEPAARALATVRQVLPSRLRHRLDRVATTPPPESAPLVDSRTLLAVAGAVGTEALRFAYTSPSSEPSSRHVEPYGVVTARARWYLVAWDLARDDWRIFRLDRMVLRPPTGRRFTPRPVPGGSAGRLLQARLRGSETGTWPCVGEAVVRLPAEALRPFLTESDESVEHVDAERCRVTVGSWSWVAVAASLARFDADLEDVSPPDLVTAMATVAARLGPERTDAPPAGARSATTDS